jgi:hypothetical protein
VRPRDAKFFRANVSAGDRATLVWNRRSTGCFTFGCGTPHALTLSNLDLSEYDSSSQVLRTSSTSAIDNVEQVMAPSGGTVVYKVKDESSTIDGLSAEPFAFAAANAITPLAAPRPTVSLTLDQATARQGDQVKVTVTASNTSSDLAGSSAQVSLNVPSGIQVVSGGSTSWSIGTLAAGASSSHEWIVKGTSDSFADFTATAQTQVYGETFTSSASGATLDVDSSPPAPAISCPGGSTTGTTVPVTWSATDASGVAGYEVLVSTDGGAFLPWLTNVTRTGESFAGQVGHSYRFAVRATDVLGNGSAQVVCGPTTIQPPTGQPVLPPPPTVGTPLPSPPRLKVSSAAVSGAKLVAAGTLAPDASGTVRATYSAAGRTVRGSARVRKGRFRLTLRLDRALRHASRGVLRISYSGDSHHSAQRVTRRVRR